MSTIYAKDPPTEGKVILYTSVGELEVELFSKECPKACRNFIQLCLEGYYDDTLFFRVVPDFIVQGGDPTNTGHGGESIYGESFKDEFHSRLKFNRRGLLGMANKGRNQNDSQFFFTLAQTPELQSKNTLFGKVEGKTVFNVLKIGEGELEGDRPVYPVKLLKTKVLVNPFDDIQPRFTNVKPQVTTTQVVTKKKKRNLNLLSFEDDTVGSEFKVGKADGGYKAVHDFDPNGAKIQPLEPIDISDTKPTSSTKSEIESTDPVDKSKESKPKKKSKKKAAEVDQIPENETPEQEFLRLQKEIKALKKKSLPNSTKPSTQKSATKPAETKESKPVEIVQKEPEEVKEIVVEKPKSGTDYLKLQKLKFKTKGQLKTKSKQVREDKILEKVQVFQQMLHLQPAPTTKTEAKVKEPVKEIVPPCLLHSLPNCLTCHPDLILDDEEVDGEWIDHRLTFSKDARVGKDNVDDYKVVDPRNLLSALPQKVDKYNKM